MESEQEQRLRQQIVSSAIRDYGVGIVAEMMGLNINQTSLVYKYSNSEAVPVPNKRWRLLSQHLTTRGDKRIVREYVDPAVLVTLQCFKGIKVNGSTKDELVDMLRELSEVEEHIKDNPNDALEDIRQMRGILNRYEAEIKEMI